MNEEEREFAKNQTDVQVWQTACFTFIILLVTCALGAWQIESTPTANLVLSLASYREPIFLLFAIAALMSGFGTLYSLWKMSLSRKKMNEPSKETQPTYSVLPSAKP